MRLANCGTSPFLTILAIALTGCSFGGGEPPALIVYVSIDQLRGDILEHYDSLFTGGFRRLHDEGFRFEEATHLHGKTSTAPGHATLGTGTYPSHNGIVGNTWLERTTDGWRNVYCMADTLSHILGHPAMPGRSPKNILRTGLADWVQEADTAALIASISRKDRAAIGMAAKARGHVYWITQNDGQFVTSSYYADSYPSWVERFNREVMPRIFGDSIWEQTIPEPHRPLSRRDTVDYEGDGEHTYFPHSFFQETRDRERPGALNRWAYGQVHPDIAVAAFAKETIRMVGLGQDEVTDYLSLSFSQADAVGHAYGPFSREQLEILLHLDMALGDLMAFLDDTVGTGRWIMALTGDHGDLTVPEYLVEMGEEGSRSTRDQLAAVRQTFEAHSDREGGSLEVADALVAELEALPIIADAITVPELLGSGPPADTFNVLLRNSYHPERWQWGHGSQGSGVVFRFKEGLYPTSSVRGTSHGSPYYYDRFVPLIFLGPGIEPGRSSDPVYSVDIVPTLALLAGISAPSDLDGVPILR
jgi:hypothetical protein